MGADFAVGSYRQQVGFASMGILVIDIRAQTAEWIDGLGSTC